MYRVNIEKIIFEAFLITLAKLYRKRNRSMNQIIFL